MTIATRLSPRAMIALGVMTLITLCLQTFTPSTSLSADAATLTRLDTIDRRISTLQATIEQIFKDQTNTTTPHISWPVQKTPVKHDLGEVAKFVFAISAIPAWIFGGLVQFCEEAGSTMAQRAIAVGLYAAIAVFVGLWHLGPPREWYGYLLGATWGFYAGLLLTLLYAGPDHVSEQKT